MKQKKNNKQKYMSKQLHRKTGIKDTNWKKRLKKSDTFVHVTKWSIQEKYDNKSIPRLWKLREENKSKQQHTQIKIGKVEDSHDTWSRKMRWNMLWCYVSQAMLKQFWWTTVYKSTAFITWTNGCRSAHRYFIVNVSNFQPIRQFDLLDHYVENRQYRISLRPETTS